MARQYGPCLADGNHPLVHLPGTREDNRGDFRLAQRKEGVKNQGDIIYIEVSKGPCAPGHEHFGDGLRQPDPQVDGLVLVVRQVE